MDQITVACVQQRLRLPRTLDEYRNDLRRFTRAAQHKQARLIVFPELAGVLLGVPLLADYRSGLLLRADQGRRRNASTWQRIAGAAAARMAGLLNVDMRMTLRALLELHAAEIWETYLEVFGDIARESGVTIVAPSAYLPDPLDGVIRNLSAVFGPGGELLGTQAKIMLHAEDQDLAQSGASWNVIQTEVGRLGIMQGNDMLYPEIGRVLAYQGAEVLVGQAASSNLALYNKLRAGMLARMQDNQLFSLISFFVGHNDIGRYAGEPFVGKSAIFAPQDLTPRFSGVLVEMGNHRSEGVLTAEWDFAALRSLWESSDTPVRNQLPLGQVSEVLANLYALLNATPGEPSAAGLIERTPPDNLLPQPAAEEWVRLDDLPVFASITRRWPLEHDQDIELGGEASAPPLEEDGANDSTAADDGAQRFSPAPIRTEDETDEMDALPQRPSDE